MSNSFYVCYFQYGPGSNGSPLCLFKDKDLAEDWVKKNSNKLGTPRYKELILERDNSERDE